MILTQRGTLKYSAANTTVTCDGNSITAGIVHTSGPAAYYPAQLSALAPISGQVTATNLGISGQTTRQMNGLDGGSTSDVDGAYVAGKKNVLIAWEGTNSIDVAGRTGAQTAQDMADYVAARLAIHSDWIIVVMTTLPLIRGAWSQATTDANNATVEAANNIMRANYRAWGAKAMIDVRTPGTPFAPPDYTLASFEAASVLPYWSANESAGTHIHLNDAGMTYIANLCAATLRRLPTR
jgi:lysophospholipase L1-like esterase